MKKFWYDGQCSSRFGLMVSGSGTYNAPERDVELISVPGRSGDLIRDNGRFKNTTVSYPAYICSDFREKAAAARSWLMGQTGYKRLEDGYNPDVYRMAMFKGPVNFEVAALSRSGELTLTFDCKPQRFLKSGEHELSDIISGVPLMNPTNFTAQPLITLYGSGSGKLVVGETVVEIKSIEDQLCLDCDTLNAYRVADSGALENKNSAIYAPEFPTLPAGETVISWSGDIEMVSIIPRWWTL